MTTPDNPEIFSPTIEDFELLNGGIHRTDIDGLRERRTLERAVFEVINNLVDSDYQDITIDAVINGLQKVFAEQRGIGRIPPNNHGVPNFVGFLYNSVEEGGEETMEVARFWESLCNAVDIVRNYRMQMSLLRESTLEFNGDIDLESAVKAVEDRFEITPYELAPLTVRLQGVFERKEFSEQAQQDQSKVEWSPEELRELLINACPQLWLERQRQEIGIKVKLIRAATYGPRYSGGPQGIQQVDGPNRMFGFDEQALSVLQQMTEGSLEEGISFSWDLNASFDPLVFSKFPVVEELPFSGEGKFDVLMFDRDARQGDRQQSEVWTASKNMTHAGFWHPTDDPAAATKYAVQVQS
ncbi:hypothetical protein HN748_00115 [Candidatus Peregrinibacteria bacterium]|jgi:hypothetical protein|nr:hypothetical protein [Candidatus Peregrinibacteria bacterium]MBT7483291.1 hypothetical protein [Candidatus Peregrinibacteria bacterium]MBT7702616.1 hypothetical protein [Candidatus Peregrinibacteria bacterium]